MVYVIRIWSWYGALYCVFELCIYLQFVGIRRTYGLTTIRNTLVYSSKGARWICFRD